MHHKQNLKTIHKLTSFLKQIEPAAATLGNHKQLFFYVEDISVIIITL